MAGSAEGVAITTRIRSAVVALTLLAAAGCNGSNVDLAAVKQYADATEAARESFDAIAADYDRSCLRIRELQIKPDQALTPPFPMPGDGDQHAGARPAPSASPFFAASGGAQTCVDLDHPDRYPTGVLSADWRHANDTLLAFVAGIGAIANVAAPPKPTGKLTAAFVDAKVLSSAQASAVDSVGTSIAAYFVRRRAERAIASYIDAVDPSFPTARTALESVGESYRQVLIAELNVTDAFYIRSLAAEANGYLVAAPPPGTPGARSATARTFARQYVIHRIREEWTRDHMDCLRRIDAAEAYVATVDRIAATEVELHTKAHRPGDIDFRTDASDLVDVSRNLHELVFPKG